MHPTTLGSFVDELEKIAISHGRMHVSKERSGRRPMSVTTMLKKDAKGALLKKHADSAGSPQDVRGGSDDDPGAAQMPKRKGEVPSRDPGNVPISQKTGSVKSAAGGASYRLTDTTMPMTSGEDMRAGNSKPRQPGEVPTQDNISVSSPDGRVEPRMGRLKPVITNDESAKRIRKGDTPTRTDDINKVDRQDLRESATTVTGLAQNSTNIGAMQPVAEHT